MNPKKIVCHAGVFAVLLSSVVFACAISAAHALGKKLPPNQVLSQAGVSCGLIKGKWVPGRLVKRNIFISHAESRKDAASKAKRAKGKKKKSLLKAAAKWAKRLKAEAPICAQANNSTPGGSALRAWTVMVYLAADNNLSLAGVQDIDEMEAGGGSSNDVAVIVQAEFNPEELSRGEITSPQQINRPNYNTFRYDVRGSNGRVGPDGLALDIGNRDMTSPNEIADFVAWSKKNYPAQNYLLVLWNHGGGFLGLLEDKTSAPDGRLASLQDVRKALLSAGHVDVIDFDMCLMAQYETLNVLKGLTDFVVASEEVEPGEGNPYDKIISDLRRRPTMTPHEVSHMIVERFHDSYDGHRASTTKSAVSMRRFSEFDGAISTAASYFSTNLGTLGADIQSSAQNAQKYYIKSFKDIKHVASLLSARAPETTSVMAAVQSLLGARDFVINNRARNGTSASADSVADSHGLSITLPSLISDDNFNESGGASFENYQAQVPNKAWTGFLEEYVQGASANESVQLGQSRPEWFLAWAREAISAGAELDMIIMEPSGDIYMPYLGTVSPNGVFTPDSFDSGQPYEGYSFRVSIAPGQYHLIGLLQSDPNSYRPAVNVFYRSSPSSQFSALYDSNSLPSLSLASSFKEDPEASFTDVFAGKYTDIRRLATWCFGDSCSSGDSKSLGAASAPSKMQLQKVAMLAQEARSARVASLGAYMQTLPGMTSRAYYDSNRVGTPYFWSRMGR